MTGIKRLELTLWNRLKQAADVPEEANMEQLWEALEETLPVLAMPDRLHVSGEAIAQIVDVFHERSSLAFEDLQAAATDDGPVMPNDAFDRYVRQTMDVDFDQFIEPPAGFPRRPPQRGDRDATDDGQSIVGVVDKARLLDVLDSELSEEEAYHQAISVAHSENVEGWIAAIAQYLERQPTSSLRLVELVQTVDYAIAEPDDHQTDWNGTLVKTWMALLLGGYGLEQRGDFYDVQSIWLI
jgi:hypothetical protein